MDKTIEPARIYISELGLDVEICAHKIMNYRYHWHDSEYEISILLSGRAVYCKGKESFVLEKDDLLIIEPCKGHSSLALEPDTISIVIRFNKSIYKNDLNANKLFIFSDCVSNKNTRNEKRFCNVRSYASGILTNAYSTDDIHLNKAKANAVLLVMSLLDDFRIYVTDFQLDINPDINVRPIIEFLEKHYMEKILLADVANYTGYNRTYLSTFFKLHTGLNFHEFLTRIRMKNALSDLTYTDKSLTDIALDNGFPELKVFSTLFFYTFHIKPSDYRSFINGKEKSENITTRILYDPYDEKIIRHLQDYAIKGIIQAK